MKKYLLPLFILLPYLAYSQNGSDKCPEGWEKHPDKHPACSGYMLPVTVKSFTVEQQANTALLKWVIGVEVNHSHYEVERSSNGLDWSYIGSTKGYSLQDKSPEPINYYRLVSIDLNGTKNYYNMVYFKGQDKSIAPLEVFDIYGKFLGVYNNRDLPKGLLIINKRKVYLY